MNRSRASLEKRTLLSTLSRDFPFDHFFFFPLPPAMAAAIFCSFDFCWTLGGLLKINGGYSKFWRVLVIIEQ